MRNIVYRISIFISISLVMILSFQNCGTSPFSEKDFEQSSSAETSNIDTLPDDDKPDLVEIKPEDYSAGIEIAGSLTTIEGGLLTIDFNLSEYVDHEIVINYRLDQGTAFAGSDFRYHDGSVVIPSGDATASITIQTLIDEDAFEGEESLYIVVDSVEGEARRPDPVIAYINEDPEQLLVRGSQSSQLGMGEKTSCAVLQFNNPHYTVKEGDLQTNDDMHCWGAEPTSSAAPLNVNTGSRNPISVVGGEGYLCYSSDTMPVCTGSQISPLAADSANIPVGKLPSEPFQSGYAHAMAAGYRHMCAIMGADRKLYCWGWNEHGQTGSATVGATEFTNPAGNVINFSIGGEIVNTKIQAVAAGTNHTCAIVRGQLFCWGHNDDRQIGVTTAEAHYTSPQPVYNMGSGVTGVALGASHTCAVKDDLVYCWGEDQFGQVGNGSSVSSLVTIPTLVPITNFSGIRRIVAGNDHTCVMNYGGVRCWGDSQLGQVGNGQSVIVTSPHTLTSPLLANVSDISAGGNHTCAVIKENPSDAISKVACWGQGDQGQNGSGNAGPIFDPAVVSNVDVLAHFNTSGAQRADLTNVGTIQVGDGDSPFTSGGGFGL